MSSRNVAYGLTFLESNLPSISGINHHFNQDGSHQDRISDSISSGFHSNGSHCSLVDENDDVDKNNTTGSLESLMEKIEKANVGRPNIRSLNSLQKTSEMISEQMEPKLMSTFLNQNKTNQNQQHFPRIIESNRLIDDNILQQQSSRLIEFTENPDYSKYYLPEVVISH